MHSRTMARSLDVSLTSPARTLRWAVVVLMSLFVLVPLVLLARRLGGELQIPLPSLLFFVCGGVYAAAAFGLRRAAAAVLQVDAPSALRRAATWLPTVCLIAFIAAIWLPGTPILAVALTLVALLAEETLAWRIRPSARGLRWDSPNRRRNPNPEQLGIAETSAAHLDEDVLQRLTQGRTDEGQAYWHGVLRAEFQPDQRVAAAHIAFCPPFAVPPEVTAWQLDGPPAEVRVTQTLCNGARLEIKLTAPASRTSLTLIEFMAQTVAPDTKTRGF